MVTVKLLIHDLEEEVFNRLYPKLNSEVKVISNSGKIKHCIGCFGCWVKEPGNCVIKDEYRNTGELYSKAEEVIIVSKCYYGSFSPFIKNVLDRAISYVLPFFTMRQGEMHHVLRYAKAFKLSAYVYGEDITPIERQTMEKLMEANKLNLGIINSQLEFMETAEQLTEIRGAI